VLRQSYIKDAERVVKRWTTALEEEGVSTRVTLPSSRFFRRQGIYAHLPFDPAGNLIPQAEWDAKIADWLPSDADRAYVASLMKPCHEQGKMANWIAAPRKGIHGNPVDFEYVKHVE
jgi:benzoyl-CoA 2,3-dioxygenase component B